MKAQFQPMLCFFRLFAGAFHLVNETRPVFASLRLTDIGSGKGAAVKKLIGKTELAFAFCFPGERNNVQSKLNDSCTFRLPFCVVSITNVLNQ